MTALSGLFAPAKGVGLAIAFDILAIANTKDVPVFSDSRFIGCLSADESRGRETNEGCYRGVPSGVRPNLSKHAKARGPAGAQFDALSSKVEPRPAKRAWESWGGLITHGSSLE